MLDVEAGAVLGDAHGADVGGGIRAVGDDPGTALPGRADEHAGRRIVEVDDGRAVRPVQPREQRDLGVAVGLPRAVQLEVLVGDVGQDGDVVGDRGDAIEGQAVRGRLDDGDLVAGIDHRAEERPAAPGASGVVAWTPWAVVLPPIRVAMVPIIPVRRPAASSAATAR